MILAALDVLREYWRDANDIKHRENNCTYHSYSRVSHGLLLAVYFGLYRPIPMDGIFSKYAIRVTIVCPVRLSRILKIIVRIYVHNVSLGPVLNT